MTRRLLILNLVLLVALAAAGWRLRRDWLAARAREQGFLHQAVKPRPVQLVTPSKPAEPVTATSYAEIADKMLFTKDRNPTVVVEAAPPPPPKPMPPLPLLYGVMNLLNGTTAIMGEKVGAKHQGVRPGDQIGDFTLVAISKEEITLDWEGKPVTKKIDEMIDRTETPQAVAGSSAQRETASAPSKAPPAKSERAAEPAPGVDVGNRLKACQRGDVSPAGTVSGGYRKVVSTTPFGESCRWEPL